MTKIKFALSAEAIEPLVDKYIENGQYFMALRLLRRMGGDVNALTGIAEILTELDLIAQSDRALYEALSIDRDNADAKELLGQNSYIKGDIASAFYYGSDDALEMITDMHEEAYFQSEETRMGKYRIVHPKDGDFVREYKPLIDEEFGKGNFEKAYKMYSELIKLSPDDIDLLNDLGFVCLMLNRPQAAKGYIEKAVAIDPDSVGAVSNAVLLYYMLGKKQETEKYAKRLDSFETDDPVKVFKIAASFCESGYHAYAKKWLDRHLELRSNLEVMLLYAEACFNDGDYDRAKETLLDILAADPENTTAGFYLGHIAELKENDLFEALEYTPQLPGELIEKKFDYLQSRAELKAMWTEKELFRDVEWALYNVTDEGYFKELTEKIASGNAAKAKEYFLKLLIRPAFDKKYKKILLKKALELGAKGEIKLVADRKFYTLYLPPMPDILREHLDGLFVNLAFERVLFKEDVEKIYAVALDLEQRLMQGDLEGVAENENLGAVVLRAASLDGLTDMSICLLLGVECDHMKKLYQTIYG